METIEQVLESKNIRVTAMRMLIYKFLAEKEIAVTLSDIENAFEKADRTTLYRTIKTFEEKDIVFIDDKQNEWAVEIGKHGGLSKIL